MSDRWYLARAGGHPIGPLRPDAVVRRIRGGTLARDTLVWAEGLTVWEPVARVPQFASEFSPEEAPDTVRALSMPPSAGEGDQAPITARRQVPKALLETTRRSREDRPGAPRIRPVPDVSAPADSVAPGLPEAPRGPDEGPSPVSVVFDMQPPVTRTFGSVGAVLVNAPAMQPPPVAEPRSPAIPTDPAPPAVLFVAPAAAEEWESAPHGGPPPPPYPSDFRIVTAPPSSVAGAPPPPSVAIPLLQPNRKRARQGPWIGVGVFGVGLAVGLAAAREILRLRAEREAQHYAERQTARLQHPLYAPCLQAPLPELTAVSMRQEISCAEGTLAVQVDKPGALAVALKGVAIEGLASQLPSITAALLPNAGPPAVSRSAPTRAVLALDLRGVRGPDRARVALDAYHDAELLLEAYETMGGHRFARWLVPEGHLDVENTMEGTAPVIAAHFVAMGSAATGVTDAPPGSDLLWGGTSPTRTLEPAYLVELRSKTMEQGYWLDDARAFMAAAVTAELPADESTAQAVGVVLDLLRASASWSEASRLGIWNGCMVPHLAALADGSRARYDALAGIWKNAQALLEHPVDVVADGGGSEYAEVYSASIGSALHASCTVDAARAMLAANPRPPETHMLASAPDAVRTSAETLLSSARFADALGEAMVRVRSQLLKPGEPLR